MFYQKALIDPQILKFGQQAAFKLKWIQLQAGVLSRLVDTIHDQTRNDLAKIHETGEHPDENVIKNLKKRQLIAIK